MSFKNQGFCSVLMSVYDGDDPRYLKAAIESILNQTYNNFEFIVILDGVRRSDLRAVINKYSSSEPIIKVVEISQCSGLGNALNSGIKENKGEFIIRMDADDISHPSRLKNLVNFMQSNPEVDVAGSYVAEFSGHMPTKDVDVIEYPCKHEQMKKLFAIRNPLAHASVIMRRRFIDIAGLYVPFSIRNEDTLLWLGGFIQGCRFANVPKVLYFIRRDKKVALRRIGLRKSFSDLIDRLRIIIDLNANLLNIFYAFGMFVVQNMPCSIYNYIRFRLIQVKKRKKFEVKQNLSLYERSLKRCFDIFSAGTVLLLTWPILLIVSIAIKCTSEGSIIFRQKRVGKRGRIFNLYKFRTMYSVKDFDSTVTVRGDTRITPLGTHLRRWKLDELPQFWNVLKGDMSIVGPRPDVPGYVDKLTGDDGIILTIRPGVTGPATLKYRNEEEILAQQPDPERYNDEVIFPDKVRINREYIDNYSFMGDIRYIIKTAIGK